MKLELGPRLVVASGNHHKVAEIRTELRTAIPDLDVVGLDAFDDPPDIAETADTFAGNATLKATGIAAWLHQTGEPDTTTVLADDSGICIDALHGDPGVFSARFAGPNATDADNNRKLVETFTDLGIDQSPAHYTCVLALVRVDPSARAPHLFEAHWPVEVRTTARGTGGFGYDPHAWLPTDKTVAELTPPQKAAQSHRGQALRQLVAAVRPPT